jgi:uncharacterized protein YdbL (DUF1318 family)
MRATFRLIHRRLIPARLQENDMRRLLWTKLALATLLGAACVTINVYFPAAAAEKAADQFIDGVWQKTAPEAPAAKPADKPSSFVPHAQPLAVEVTRAVLEALVPPAQAADANIDVNSPAIRAIQSSMAARHSQLAKYYDSGAIGLTGDGMIEVRDQNAVPLPERGTLRQLVADDNRDRGQLYAEVARANGHPEWEADIRAAFARRWVARAQSGWYYQDGGRWVQK